SGVGVSVLLRQPHGFEGLGVIPEELNEDGLTLAHRGDGGDLELQVRTTTFGAPDEPRDDSVTQVDEFDQFKSVGVEGLTLLFPLAHNCLSAHDWFRSFRPTIRIPHDD